MEIVVCATDDDVNGRPYKFHKVMNINAQACSRFLKPRQAEVVKQDCLPMLLTRMEPGGVMLRLGTKLYVLGVPTEPQQNDDDHTLACRLELNSKKSNWEDFKLPRMFPDTTPRCTALDGRIYYFGYSIGLEPRPIHGEWGNFVCFPAEFPKCRFSLISDPQHERILLNFLEGKLLYAYYPFDNSFKLLSTHSSPCSDIMAVVNDILYIYDPCNALDLYAYDLLDGANPLDVVWATKRLPVFEDEVEIGRIPLEKHVYKAIIHVGYNTFWLVHWSINKLSFLRFNTYRIGGKIMCSPFEFRSHEIEGRIFNIVPEVTVSTLPHIDDDMSAPVPLSLDRTLEMESIVDLFDKLIIMEATWHEGKSLDTLKSSIYLQRLDSLKEYHLLYPILKWTSASYYFKASDEEKVWLRLYNIEEEVEFKVKLEPLENCLLAWKANSSDEDIEKLCGILVQIIKFRKFLHLALRRMSNPCGQRELIKTDLENSLQALLQYSTIRPTKECESVGFRKCTTDVLTWTESVHHFEKLLQNLKHMFSYPLLKLPLENSKNLANTTNLNKGKNLANTTELKTGKDFANTEVGKLVLKMFKVLCQESNTQRASLVQIADDCGKLVESLKKQKFGTTPAENEIIVDAGRFTVVQSFWSLLQMLKLGFETNVYNFDEYACIYFCISQCHQYLLPYMDGGRGDEATFLECSISLLKGLLHVLFYLKSREEKVISTIICQSDGTLQTGTGSRVKKTDVGLDRERFMHLVPYGFDYDEMIVEIGAIRPTLVKSVNYFKHASRVYSELEDGTMCREAKRMKTVAKRNQLAVKSILKLQGHNRSLPRFDFSHYATMRI